MRAGEAVMELSRLGFCFRLEGEAVKVRFEGHKKPNPDLVANLMYLLRQHRDEVREFLRSYCPRCGGVVFGTFDGREFCMACTYRELKNLMPGLDLKH